MALNDFLCLQRLAHDGFSKLSQMVELLKCVVVQEAKHFYLVSLFNRLCLLIGFYHIYTYNGKSIVCPTSSP